MRHRATGGFFAAALLAAGCTFHPHGAPFDAGAPGDLASAGDLAEPDDLATAPVDVDLATTPTGPDLLPMAMPMLTGMRADPSGDTVDLTTEGTFDWVHFGENISITDTDRLANGPAAIVQTVTGNEMAYGQYSLTFKWSNGAPTQSDPGTTTGVYVGATGNGFKLTLPAGIAPHTVRVYVGQYKSTATFTAHLSDGSAADFSDSQTAGNSELYSRYTVTYAAGSDGQTLVLTWVDSNGNSGNVDLMAVTLQ